MNICNALKNNGDECKIYKNTEKINYKNKDIYLCKIHARVLKNNKLKIDLDKINYKEKQKKEEIKRLSDNLQELNIDKNEYEDFCGKINIYNFIKFLKKHNKILIKGSSGIGKSLSIKLIFDNKKYDIIYYEDGCLFEFFEKNNNESLKNKEKVLIIDNIEELNIKEIRNIIKIIELKIINSKILIIFICNDTQMDYKNLKLIEKYVYTLKFKTPNESEIIGFIEKMCIKYCINISYNKIKEIILSKRNDIRSIMNDILFYKNSINNINIHKNNVKLNTFEAFNEITSKIESEKKFDIFEQYDNLDLMLYENYCNRYINISQANKKIQDLSFYDSIWSENIYDNYVLNKYKHSVFYDIKDNFSNVRIPSYFNFENKRKRKHESIKEEYSNYKKKYINTNLSIEDFIYHNNHIQTY